MKIGEVRDSQDQYTIDLKAIETVPVPSSGLFSRVAGSSALEYREQHDDGEVQEGSSVSATGDSAESEARSLRKFHRAMGGKGWRRKHGWGAADSDAPQFALEDYDGVTVGPGGRVDQIRLRDNNLSATVFLTHPEHFPRLNRWSYLSGLRSLTVLDLSNNSQRGLYNTLGPMCIVLVTDTLALYSPLNDPIH